MQKHEEATSTDTLPGTRFNFSGSRNASETQVTVQQLVRALTAIEVRQEEKPAGETIAIGEAVRELGLSVTPEQILAEVRKQEAVTAPKPVRPTRRRAGRLALAVTAFALLGFTFTLTAQQNTSLFTTANEITYPDFLNLVKGKDVSRVSIAPDKMTGITSNGVAFWVSVPENDRNPIQRDYIYRMLGNISVPYNIGDHALPYHSEVNVAKSGR